MAQPEENGVNSNTMIPEIHSNTHSTIHRPNKIQKLQIPTQFQIGYTSATHQQSGEGTSNYQQNLDVRVNLKSGI